MDEGKNVWIPDSIHGYIIGRIKDIGTDTVTVEPRSTPGKTVAAPYDQVFPCEEYEDKDVDDNCALMFLNEATLLNNVRLRYTKNAIYTYVANILIALNPYTELSKLYSKEAIKSYQGKSLGTMPPHVFAIADKAYRDMKVLKESQSIIVSGESGAGKTESTKYILKYLTECWGTHAGPIEQRIVESNPLLEAFGNAKTMRNNNSSRFGKFIEIHFDPKYQVCGGHISHYLLEKSRICVQSEDERNYHVFYRLCAGAPQKLRDQLKLSSPDNFHYLKRGCTQYFCSKENESKLNQNQKSQQFIKRGSLRDIQMDDVSDFKLTDNAMTHMGLTEAEKLAIYTIIAGVLHLGNVVFEESSDDTTGGCKIAGSSEPSLQLTAQFLGCDKAELNAALVSRMMQTSIGGRRGSAILVPLKVTEAQSARDALAKAVYARLFDYIVSRVNQALPFASSKSYIGVLDIAGFEYFQTNSFEQFCINYCNEKLQQFFNERILKEEQALYEKEGLKVKKIHYTDNQDCIDLIEGKGIGIFDILDEENKLPKPSTEHFTDEVHKKNKNHYRLSIPRKSKLKSHREIRDDEGFLVRHFAGAVCYHTVQFIEKNNDALHTSLEALVLQSKSDLLRQIFETADAAAGTMPSVSSTVGKLTFISVGSKFRSQLSVLMEKLRSTGTNFIRCIKPNSKMADHLFEGTQILAQLQCSGMPSVLDLMHQGFPSRTQFVELYNMYKHYMPPNIARLDPRLFCKALFKALGLNENDFKFGLTKVFFRPGKFKEFDQIMKSDPEHLAELIKRVQKWLICTRWRKVQWCALSVIKLKNKIELRKRILMRIQATIRMWRVRRQYKPRILCISKVRPLFLQLEPMRSLAGQLKKDRESALSKVAALETEMQKIVTKIQKSEVVSRSEVDSVYDVILKNMNVTLAELKTMVERERVAEEQDRLRKIQEEMEKERKRKEEEERVRRIEDEKKRQEEEERKRREEEERRQKAEIEARRVKEEELRKQKEEEEKHLLEERRKQQEQEAAEQIIKQQRMEQEHRDRELALRLAQEDQSQVEDLSRYDYSLPAKHSTVRVPGQRILPLPSDNMLRSRSSTQLASNAAPQQSMMRTSIQPASMTGISSILAAPPIDTFDPLGPRKKQDLQKMTYAELRDTINTSCDIELLDACREEFHRRLKVYHEWKMRNNRQNTPDHTAPQFILETGAFIASTENSALGQMATKAESNPFATDIFGAPPMNEQRYFRIPFDRPLDPFQPQAVSRGWWFAHFDGKWIARQMEIHPQKPAQLLIAGVDDMKMCNLGLPETGLTAKPDAEITELEFERDWARFGGTQYLYTRQAQVSSKYLQMKMKSGQPLAR